MKHIKKECEPVSFTNWKKNFPTLGYKDLKDTPKKELKESLIKEQNNLCCYCECFINPSNSHIEHFQPKDNSQFPELQLVYNNLHASCGKFRTSIPEEHCGHRKSNRYSPDLISPLEPDCASHFSFNTQGRINSTDKRGATTIEILHIDSALLNNQRKKLIDFFEELPEDEKLKEVQHHLAMNGEFYSMVDYLKEELSETSK